ncbi:YopT-type cysteine protease domain-containing protein [Inquilinus sp.]|jgi:hypothetical protein|uniref:YopT-type cysteine protease domain-containing protein n=1 Tax=Inquilinus sp. TaxID=1932117 RepID=UPI003783CC73
MPFPGHVIYPIDNYSFSTGDGPGACSALCVHWLTAMDRNPIIATWTTPHAPNFMGTKAQIEQTQAEYENRDLGDDDEFNILRPNGFQVLAKGTFPIERQEIEKFLKYCFANPGSYYISLSFADLQHNIAIYTGNNGYIIFDPNGGAYRSGGQSEFVSSYRYWFDEYDTSYQEAQWFRCVYKGYLPG